MIGGGDDGAPPDEPSFAELMGGNGKRPDETDRAPPPRPPRKTPGAAAGRAQPPGLRFPDPEQPRLAAAEGVNDATLRALTRGEPPPGERIELHGVRADAAERLLAQRLEAARARGLRCVVVVHGRGARSPGGEAVLRDALPGWLAGAGARPHVLASAPAPRSLGGEGATLVLLRRGD